MLRQLFLALVVPIILVQCSEEIRKAVDEAKCAGQDINMNEEDMTLILDCSQELGIKSKADFTADKMPCFSRCMIEKQGLIDHDGGLHKEKIKEIKMKSQLPENLQAEIRKQMEACLDTHGAQVNAKDPTCKSFEPLTTCVHAAFKSVCKAEM